MRSRNCWKTAPCVNKRMVYETKSLEICHGLTPKGEKAYRKMLEEKADEILFWHRHPVKWLISKIVEWFDP